ncbi:arsenate reductase/protein-tyrosine-phosphatase family protein [Geodermatophilus sp. SYSU D01176]
MALLFVCTGNICRSAAAERLMSAWTARLPGRPLESRSAGTRAVDGRPMHPLTAAALERHGVWAAGFASWRLTGEEIDWADLVLTMTTGHRGEVLALQPRAMRKVFTLREAATLAGSLPAGYLGSVHPEDRLARLADDLAETRALRRGVNRDHDIADPIDGPADAHVAAVDEIATALVPLVAVLDVRPLTEETVRITRLPPVPAFAGNR